MKKLFGINLVLALAIIFASCGTNNNVVNNRLISKRKFNKGFHINTKGKMKSSKEEKEGESIAFNDSKKKESKEVLVSEDVRRSVAPKTTSRVEETARVENSSEENDYRSERRAVDAAVDSYEAEATDETSYPGNVAFKEKEETKDTKDLEKKQERKKNKKSNQSDDAMFILIVIVTILIPPLGVAIYTNIDWMKVLICLLLCFLFFLPGLIYGLLVVFDVI